MSTWHSSANGYGDYEMEKMLYGRELFLANMAVHKGVGPQKNLINHMAVGCGRGS